MTIKIEIDNKPGEKSSHLKYNLVHALLAAGFDLEINDTCIDSWTKLTATQEQPGLFAFGQNPYEQAHDHAFVIRVTRESLKRITHTT